MRLANVIVAFSKPERTRKNIGEHPAKMAFRSRRFVLPAQAINSADEREVDVVAWGQICRHGVRGTLLRLSAAGSPMLILVAPRDSGNGRAPRMVCLDRP